MDQKDPSGSKASKYFPSRSKLSKYANGSKALNILQWTKNHHENSFVSKDHQLNLKQIQYHERTPLSIQDTEATPMKVARKNLPSRVW